MILRFYPSKDATIYEQYPSRNTGLDAALDISKVVGEKSGSSYFKYNSRSLINFDFAAISSSITELGLTASQLDWTLKLYLSDASEIPLEYSVHCYPVSGAWSMGIGRFKNFPETREGVSWLYRFAQTQSFSAWLTSSYSTIVTGSWQTNPGGGNWYTSSVATQSYSYSHGDASFNVTDILLDRDAFTSFDGFLIKKSDQDESSELRFKSLKFFSMETNTVFHPVLEASYDDSTSAQTIPYIDLEQEFNILPINLQKSYTEGSTPKIRFSARPRYPSLTFSTSSLFLNRFILSGSQYAIYTADADNVVVDFGSGTKLSDDSTSNYFNLSLSGFQPERYYRVLLKVPNSGSSTFNIYDEDWIFKVTRNL